MKADKNEENLRKSHVSALSQQKLFFVLCVAVLLTGTHAFVVSHSRIQQSIRWVDNATLLAAAASSGGNKQPVASTKKPPNKNKRPPGRQRYNKKYNEVMAQAIVLNKKLIQCESNEEILSLLASKPGALTKMAGGGALNSVNFSTALHRMARFCSYDQQARKKTLNDPRFALFFCSLTEAMAGMDYTASLSDYHENKDCKKKLTLSFESRLCSNVAWAIAKIRLAPPLSTLPITLSGESDALVETSLKCRLQVLEGAREKQNVWIPTLSLLSGRLMDEISYISFNSTTAFTTQELANLLWALSTAQRADAQVFQHISLSLVDIMTLKTKPQEFSNSIWAFGTAGIVGEGQELLIKSTAKALTDDPTFFDQWKCQEISCAAWGVAKILSNKSERSPEEDACALTILREVAKALTVRADECKSQEIANSCWSLATLGFGEMETTASSQNDYIYLKSGDLEGDRRLMEKALHAVAKSVLPRLNEFRSQELNNLSWAYARLGRTECTDLYAAIGREFSNPRRVVTGQDIGTTCWALATANYIDEEAYRAIVSRMNPNEARNYIPQELSNTIYALGTAGVEVKYPDVFDTTVVPEDLRQSDWRDDPVTVFFAVAATELMRRPHEFKSQEIKDILHGFSKVRISADACVNV